MTGWNYWINCEFYQVQLPNLWLKLSRAEGVGLTNYQAALSEARLENQAWISPAW